VTALSFVDIDLEEIPMRKLPLIATAAMFLVTEAAVAVPLPSATGLQLRGMDETPIISVKKKKRHKKSSASSGESMSQPGNPNAPATAPMQGGATQGSGSMGGGGGMGGAPTTGTSR
jgi:hypothetical protein